MSIAQSQAAVTTFHLPSWDEATSLADDCTTVLPETEAQSTWELVAQGNLASLKTGLDQKELDRWIEADFLDKVAGVDLSTDELGRIVTKLVDRLHECGYRPKKAREYEKLWKQLAREKQGVRMKGQATEGNALGVSSYVIRKRIMPGANNPAFIDPLTGERRTDAPPLTAFETEGIMSLQGGNPDFITNFSLVLDEEVRVEDEFDSKIEFRGKLRIYGKEREFKIDAAAYADNKKLREAITVAAGTDAVIDCGMDELRKAISMLSRDPGKPKVCHRLTKNFGWTADGGAYLVPAGKITAEGFTPVDDTSELRVDLGDEENARALDLVPAKTDSELRRVKKHVVEDLLTLHDPKVTYSLLGAVGVASLSKFAPNVPPFVLWLVGLTGEGKSMSAKLFMNFFGDFPEGTGRFATWSSTANFLQRTGYFFKDSLFLVDDYKPEVVPHYQVVRILQNYADRAGRGRLKSDATANTTRPIRGLMVCTGEDVPEHTASALARSVIVNVPSYLRDTRRRDKCFAECQHYRCVTADFIQQVLAQRRNERFARRVQRFQGIYARGIEGQQNDSRIASNLALLAAGFYEMASYLADVWPDWREAVKVYCLQDLMEVRNELVVGAKEQQASEVFCSVLGTLIEHRLVSLDPGSQSNQGTVVGKPWHPSHRGTAVAGHTDLCYISTELALGAVNESLRKQGRPVLSVTISTLLDHLRRDGWVLGEDGLPVGEGSGKQRRIEGRLHRCFLASKSALTGTVATKSATFRPTNKVEYSPSMLG